MLVAERNYVAGYGIQDIDVVDLDMVGGGLSIYWSHQPTNWGEVLAWGAGGAVAGIGGGGAGMAAGAIGGAGADYVGQHLHIYL